MKRILIIDDEKDIRFLLSTILVDEGYETLQEGTVEEAEGIIGNKALDFGIVDISLKVKKKRWNFSIKRN